MARDDPYFAQFEALFTAADREGLVELGMGTWAVADSVPEAEAQIRSGVAGIFVQGGYLMPDPAALDRLHEVRVPTQLIVGSLDHRSVISCAKAVAASIPGCRMTTVTAADHMLPLREPDLLAGIITGQLDHRA